MNQDIAGFASIGADINKTKGSVSPETEQGVVSPKLSELSLEMPNEDLLKLTKKWEKKWSESAKKSEWDKQGEENKKYWLGKHFDKPSADKDRAIVDNLIFESVETYLPQITRRNPEPMVSLDNSELDANGNAEEAKQKYVQKVKGVLADLADKNVVRLKLKRAGRHWAIYLLGIAKFGWDMDKDIPTVRIIRPKKIILDPDATVTEDGYSGSYIGEYRKMEASKFLKIIENDPESKETVDKIKEDVGDDLGTEIQFIEWWTAEYMCWEYKKTIGLKKKNPHWNYDRVEPSENVDDYGNVVTSEEEIQGINHLPVPQMPYELLAMFGLDDQPMDETSLIGQNLSNQDMINKRNRQIDKNADRMNGGMVVSLARSGLTQAQAKNVTSALAKGGTVVIPDGSPREAVDQYSPNGLPVDIYNDLTDKRNRMRDIFGTRGSSAAGLESESTVRGKILNRGTDTDRIGGGVSEYLEQLADKIYNWFIQLEYVYDPAFQFVGGGRPPKIVISVKEGSLLPKDSTTIANQAIELATANKMSTLDLYKRLEYPNPEELAANVWLEANAPQVLYSKDPRIAQVIQMQQQAALEAEQKQKQNEIETMQIKHEQDIEKEKVKTRGDIVKQTAGSILKEVPQETAT